MLFLFVTLVPLGGLFSGLCFLRKGQLDRHALEDRAKGKAALDAGDYPKALAHLERYLNRHADDAEVLYWSALARRRTPLHGRKHIDLAIEALRRSLELNPGQAEARRALLELLGTGNRSVEALRLAGDLLEREPEDVEALKAKAIALARLGRRDDALSTAERVNEVAPDDIDGYCILFSLLAKMKSPAELLARAEALSREHREDPRFELLRGMAYFLANDRESACAWIRSAALKAPPDARFAKALVNQLDTLGLFEESLSVLERAEASHRDPELRQALIRRLWELGRCGEIVDRLSSRDLRDGGTGGESESLALLAMSLIRLERKKEALPMVEALAARRDDLVAQAWAAALEEMLARKDSSLASRIKSCQKAVAACPESPYFRYFLGEVYAGCGESEKAIEAWTLASRQAPAWALPCLEKACLLAKAGHASEALKAGQEARRRNPQDPAVAVAWALSLSSGLSTDRAEGVNRLLDLVNRIQEAWPGEEETLLLQIDLLLRVGSKSEAIHRIDAVLEAESLPSQETLIRLSGLSRRASLGLEEACLKCCEVTYGLTPELAFARAVIASQSGSKEAGLHWLVEGMGRESDLDPSWRIVRALYLDFCRDPRASNAWTSLGDGAPENIRIQKLALKAKAAWQDRAFIDRATERLRKLTGGEAVGWRLARARWILEASTSDREAAQAACLVNEALKAFPGAVEARQLLRLCLQRLKGGQVGDPGELARAETLAGEEPIPSPEAGPMTTVDCGSVDGGFDGGYFPLNLRASRWSPKAGILVAGSIPDGLGDVVAGDFAAPSLFFYRPTPAVTTAEDELNESFDLEKNVVVTLPPPLWIGAFLLAGLAILFGVKRKHAV
jgi:tetratricopeptide (TPR) repeat protein